MTHSLCQNVIAFVYSLDDETRYETFETVGGSWRTLGETYSRPDLSVVEGRSFSPKDWRVSPVPSVMFGLEGSRQLKDD